MYEVMAGELPEFADGTLGMALNLEQNAVGAVIFNIAIDAIINQKDCLCVYVAVGQKASTSIVIMSALFMRAHAPQLQATAESNQEFLADGQLDVAAIETFTVIMSALFMRAHAPQLQATAESNQEFLADGQLGMALNLGQHDSLATTVLVKTGVASSPALQFVAPYTGATVAEYFMYQGKATATRHPQGYREMCLLLRRPPGREAYPGDVFYLHARLLERAATLNYAIGGGSMTSLPVVSQTASTLGQHDSLATTVLVKTGWLARPPCNSWRRTRELQLPSTSCIRARPQLRGTLKAIEKCACYCGDLRGVRPTPETCSTCTLGSWSGPRR
jgi:F-type H+-transporting ATPase subunit alpha